MKKQKPPATATETYEQIRTELGEFLKDCRKKQNLSQGALAQALGYESPQYVSDWERGASSIPMKKFTALVKILKVSEDELFEKMLRFAKSRIEESMVAELKNLTTKPTTKRQKRVQ